MHKAVGNLAHCEGGPPSRIGWRTEESFDAAMAELLARWGGGGAIDATAAG